MASRKLPIVPNPKDFHLYLERCGIQGILRQVTKEVLERPSRASNIFVYVERRIRELGEERHKRLVQERYHRRRQQYPVGKSSIKHSFPALAFGTKVTDPEALDIFENRRRYRGSLIMHDRNRSPAVKLEKFLNTAQPNRQCKVKASRSLRKLHSSQKLDGNDDLYDSDEFESEVDHTKQISSAAQANIGSRNQITEKEKMQQTVEAVPASNFNGARHLQKLI